MSTKRRGRGEGAIFRRADGVWCATVTIGYDAIGKRRRRTVYGSSKEHVRQRLTELQSQALHGGITRPTQITLGKYLQRWLEDVVKPNVRASTYQMYEGLVRLHVNPQIGGIRLTRLSAAEIQGLYATMLREGASARMCQLVHARLHSALKNAVRWKLIPTNPILEVDRPAAPTKRFTPLTPEQVVALLNAAEGTRLHALYVLAVTTGLRQGELLGLHWVDIDLDAGTLSVRHQLTEVAGKLELTEPKTAAGRRQVVLPTITVEALAAHRDRLRAKGRDGVWVFPGQRGGPMRKSSLRRKSFEPLLKKAGLSRIRFHDLRHTSPTLLLLQEVHPKIVQERLGHSRIGITLDTYSHVLPTMQHAAAEKLDQLIQTTRTHVAAEQARSEAAAAIPKSDVAARTGAQTDDERDWLQLGYKPPETPFSDSDPEGAKDAESMEDPKWSHLDLNQGPPACEAGALTS